MSDPIARLAALMEALSRAAKLDYISVYDLTGPEATALRRMALAWPAIRRVLEAANAICEQSKYGLLLRIDELSQALEGLSAAVPEVTP